MKTPKPFQSCPVHQRFAALMQVILSPEPVGYGSLNSIAKKSGKGKATLSEWASGQISPQLSSLEMLGIGWSTQDFIEALASKEDPAVLVQRKKKVVLLHPCQRSMNVLQKIN